LEKAAAIRRRKRRIKDTNSSASGNGSILEFNFPPTGDLS